LDIVYYFIKNSKNSIFEGEYDGNNDSEDICGGTIKFLDLQSSKVLKDVAHER
jgi:hypothetical protein